jgi:hypothetical protein
MKMKLHAILANFLPTMTKTVLENDSPTKYVFYVNAKCCMFVATAVNAGGPTVCTAGYNLRSQHLMLTCQFR